MILTKKIVMEVAHHEGLIRQAYKDSVGVWTWGVGLTSQSGHRVERYIDNPQPLERCLEVWLWALQRYADEVEKAFDRPLEDYQKAAALSFHWNTGAISYADWVADFNRGQPTQAYSSIMNWRSPSEVIPRREAERDLFFYKKWAGNGTMTEYTRLTSRYTPVWSSARKVEVSSVLDKLLG